MDLVQQINLINSQVDSQVDQLKIIAELNKYGDPRDRLNPDIFIITDIHDHLSVTGARAAQKSIVEQNIAGNVFMFNQTNRSSVESDLDKITSLSGNLQDVTSLKWDWPTSQEQEGFDIGIGLYKNYLENHKQDKLMFQTITHIMLWDYCIKENKTIVIMNSNSVFVRNFSFNQIVQQGFVNGVIGLNVLNGETHNNDIVRLHTDKIKLSNTNDCQLIRTPSLTLADLFVNEAQPFMGHGAYIITPWAAEKAMKTIKTVGMWPIQFLLCRQFAPWTYIYWPQVVNVKGTYSTVWKPPQ